MLVFRLASAVVSLAAADCITLHWRDKEGMIANTQTRRDWRNKRLSLAVSVCLFLAQHVHDPRPGRYKVSCELRVASDAFQVVLLGRREGRMEEWETETRLWIDTVRGSYQGTWIDVWHGGVLHSKGLCGLLFCAATPFQHFSTVHRSSIFIPQPPISTPALHSITPKGIPGLVLTPQHSIKHVVLLTGASCRVASKPPYISGAFLFQSEEEAPNEP